MKNFILGSTLVLFLSGFANAQELLAPNPHMSAKRVVEIQLTALQRNDSPSIDAGIVQT